MSSLQLKTEKKPLANAHTALIVRGIGTFDSDEELEKVENYFNNHLQQGHKFIIFDISQIGNITSTSMGLLVKLSDAFTAKGGYLLLIGVAEKIIALFDMLGLSSIIQIFEDEQAALAFIETAGEMSSAKSGLTDAQMKSIHEALKAGKKIEAIKQYRHFTGLGLAEAKGFIDELHASLQSEYPEQFPQTQATGCLVIFILASLSYFLY